MSNIILAASIGYTAAVLGVIAGYWGSKSKSFSATLTGALLLGAAGTAAAPYILPHLI